MFYIFPQIAQICTDAVRGGLIPQIAPSAADATEAVRVLLVLPQIAQICTDARSGRFLFSTQIAPLAPRSKREFCYNVTCYMLQ